MMSTDPEICSDALRLIVPASPDSKVIESFVVKSTFAALTAAARLPGPELSRLVTVIGAASALPANATAVPTASPPAASSRCRASPMPQLWQLLRGGERRLATSADPTHAA